MISVILFVCGTIYSQLFLLGWYYLLVVDGEGWFLLLEDCFHLFLELFFADGPQSTILHLENCVTVFEKVNLMGYQNSGFVSLQPFVQVIVDLFANFGIDGRKGIV